MKLAIKSIPLANVNLFLGTSFKRIKPIVDLSKIYKRDERVEVLTLNDLDAFLSMYEAYKNTKGVDLRVAPKINRLSLTESLYKKEAILFGIKDDNDVLVAGVVIYFLRLPNNLGELYFGNNFNRFGLIRMFCCRPNTENMAITLMKHVLLELQSLGLKACLAYVTPQHKYLCDLILPKNLFKRCEGQNFTPDNEAVFCLELNV